MASISTIVRTLARRAAPRRGVRGFGKSEDGATAVEFALIALPFFALILAIIETALASAGRLIRTGQAQSQGLTADTFKQSVCSRLSVMFDCSTSLYVDVKTYTDFSSISLSVPVDANGNLKTVGYTYTPGHGGSIVVVRAYYKWPVFVNQLGNNLSNMPDGTHLLTATAAFRNEPFPW